MRYRHDGLRKERRQNDPAGIVAAADHSYANYEARQRLNRPRQRHGARPRWLFRRTAILKDGRQSTMRTVGHLLVDPRRLVEAGDVADESAHVDFSRGEKVDEALHVAPLGPPDIAEGIIDPALLIGRVVAARAVGA